MQSLAPELLHHAKRAVIDWHAALFPGAVAPPALLLERSLKEELDRGGARLALGRSATVRAAALINGSAAHTVEVDDIFRDGIYHPGAPTVAAALALAQARGASGAAFLRALIVGYEISTRIAAAMGRAHYKYWHNTGTIGCFGAAERGGRAARTRRGPFRACARNGRHVFRRIAAGISHGLDVQAFARRARSGSRCHGGACRERGRHRIARYPGGRNGIRARHGRGPGLGARIGNARRGFSHHPHDLQESRLLRPRVRCDRRRLGAAKADARGCARNRTRASRHLQGSARCGALRSAAHSGRGPILAQVHGRLGARPTAACGSRPSNRRDSRTRPRAS